MDLETIEHMFREHLESHSESFGYVCFFGSLNLENDLDVFLMPSKGVKLGWFLKESIELFERVRNEVERAGSDLMLIWHSTFEDEAEYLNTKPDALKIHVSSFPDIVPEPIPNFLPHVRDAPRVLLGDETALDEPIDSSLIFFYRYLSVSNCLFSNYPADLELKKVTEKANYIYKHLDGVQREQTGSAKDRFFACCDFIDEKDEEARR